MLILGFESSCDETGVALVDASGAGVPRLLGEALHSQIEMHQAYGGVVPELASRTHVEHLDRLVAEALAEVGVPSDTSLANFVLARFADAAEAEACDLFLRDQGLIVRRVAGYKLPHCLRITVSDESACRRVAHAVAQFKGKR